MSNVEDRLHPEHLADLRKSGLSDETIEQARLATVRPNDIRKITSDERVTSLLEIPYDAEFSRYKVFPTNLKAKTKSGHFRYLQPAKTSVHLYIPPGAEVALKDLAISFGLVEGEKKALKAMQEGLLCCGLGGLYNWLEDGRLIPALKEIPLKGRAVVLYPDSDVWRRADLLEPVYRLGCALEAKGAAVTVCALPHGAGETKQGLDDYLVAESTEALHARPHVPLTHKRFDRARKKAKARDNFGKPAARPEVVTMSDVQAEPVNWLFWP
jgi:hypothetical protein